MDSTFSIAESGVVREHGASTKHQFLANNGSYVRPTKKLI
jgi:hypothetical protein